MKCNNVLKKVFDENISDALRQNIEEHVSTCPFCQERLEISDSVGAFLNKQKVEKRDNVFWSNLLREIRSFIDEKEKKWWSKLGDMMPVQLSSPKIVIAGATMALTIFVAALFTLDNFNSYNMAGDVSEETEEFMEEHLLSQDPEILGTRNMGSIYFTKLEKKK